MRTVRPLLFIFLATTLIGALQLYVRYDSAETTFAWTIEPPLSAAFLGAGYAAGFALTALTLRDGRWATARLAALTVLVFVWLTLLVTLGHIDRFHLDEGSTLEQVAAWLWLGIYILVPLWMTGALYIALREEQPVVVARPMPAGMRAVLAVLGGAMIGVGVAMIVDPEWVAGAWPWELTPLTARTIAAWLIALGFAAFVAIREGDLDRLRPASLSFTVFAALQALALVRYEDDVRWGEPGTAVYLGWIAIMLAAGIYGAVAGTGERTRGRARGTTDAPQ